LRALIAGYTREAGLRELERLIAQLARKVARRVVEHRERAAAGTASTSAKNAAYPDTVYVDNLIGPDTVNTLPEAAIAAFEDHGRVKRTIDTGVADAAEAMEQLAGLGIDMDDVGRTLEEQGVASFHDSFAPVLGALKAKTGQLAQG